MIAQRTRTVRARLGTLSQTGQIVSVLDGMMNVRTPSGVVRATRAVSCLVAPEVGDLVLVAGDAPSHAYVLAILERPRSRHIRLEAAGNVTMDLPQGHLTLAAAEGVNLVSQQSVSVVADRIDGRAREGTFLLGSMNLIAEAVTSTMQRLSQTVKRVFRRVEEIEHVRAGQIDYASQGLLSLHGDNTLISARQLVKADGKQIHIG